MDYQTDNTRIVERLDIIPPINLLEEMPISEKISSLVYGTRNEISSILHGKDDRLLVVCGPCSIHNPDSAIEYATKLKEQYELLNKDLLIVMRVYFEKPRTTVGWKGLINDPDLNGTFDINKGIRLSRSLLLEFGKMGLPCGTEFLDLISPQYIADLISW